MRPFLIQYSQSKVCIYWPVGAQLESSPEVPERNRFRLEIVSDGLYVGYLSVCDPTSAITQCSNNAAASINTQERPLVTLCQPFFEALVAQGCIDPATQSDQFGGRFQDAILLHEFTHLNIVNGKPITDNPTGQGPSGYDVAGTKEFVGAAEHGGSAYAVAAKMEGLAAAYVFFAWRNWAKSSQCVAERENDEPCG